MSAVKFSLDGREVEAREGESILQAAQRHGVDIPHLCYKEGLRADGNCRACIEALGCPAIVMDPTREHVVIDPVWCIGCGVCADVCSNRALTVKGTSCQ